MKRTFAVVVILDVTLLLIPTKWMGTTLEIGVASVLAAVTALFWLWLRFAGQER